MFSRKNRSRLENIEPVDGGGLKNRPDLPGKVKRSDVKRSALGDIANAEIDKVNNADLKKKVPIVKAKVTTKSTSSIPVVKAAASKPAAPAAAAVAKRNLPRKNEKKPVVPVLQKKTRPPSVSKAPCVVLTKPDVDVPEDIDVDTSVILDRVEEDISVIEEEDDGLLAFDRENLNDIYLVSVYAQDIFNYYKRREEMFHVPNYMRVGDHPITPAMRAILVDWMVEIQENFELNHETLYLAVKLTDIYLSRKVITKDNLQLVGAVALFVSSKFDEQRYPLIEDFTYVCDNAFDSRQFLEMEMDLLKRVDFDLGIPLSYRFVRRYAKVAKLPMPTLTLARYILELSLMESEFITQRESKLAAAALYLALKMRNSPVQWTGDLVKASGYELSDFKAVVTSLNSMMLTPTLQNLTTIRTKYSHSVFHQVAKIRAIGHEKLW